MDRCLTKRCGEMFTSRLGMIPEKPAPTSDRDLASTGRSSCRTEPSCTPSLPLVTLKHKTSWCVTAATFAESLLKGQSANRDFVADTLLQMALDVPPMPEDLEESPSSSTDAPNKTSTNIHELQGLLATPAFYHLCYHCSKAETQPQLRPLRSQPSSLLRRPVKKVINPVLSRLHAISASHLEQGGSDRAEHRGFLRSLVYSAKNYREANDWGPFHEDGTVDWALFDAIASVMSRS